MTPPSPGTASPFTVLRLPEFRAWLISRSFNSLAASGLVIIVGYQVYALTHDPLALGWLGLVEAIPALTLALIGGHFADRHDRRRILLVTQSTLALCAAAYTAISASPRPLGVLPIYGVAFCIGLARGFANPAATAFEAQVVPGDLYAAAMALINSMWQIVGLVGPALAGIAYASLGPTRSYLGLSLLFALALAGLAVIRPKSIPPPVEGESMAASIAAGVRYVWHSEILFGSMALDLFAVLFGGALALLPAFASDILRVGPIGYGLMQSAPAAGALLALIVMTRLPWMRRAGPALLWCVAGFGVSMIVFGWSRNFVVSLLALAASGLFDSISVVIRMLLLRLYSPEDLRARIAAVQWIFIGASNEVGAFESGIAARLLGTAPSVIAGGVVTLGVVALVRWRATQLRRLNLEIPPDLTA